MLFENIDNFATIKNNESIAYLIYMIPVVLDIDTGSSRFFDLSNKIEDLSNFIQRQSNVFIMIFFQVITDFLIFKIFFSKGSHRSIRKP